MIKQKYVALLLASLMIFHTIFSVSADSITGKIFAFDGDSEIFLDSDGGAAEFTLFVKDVDVNDLGCYVVNVAGEREDFNYTVTQNGARRTVTIIVPENQTVNQQEYSVKFSVNKQASTPTYAHVQGKITLAAANKPLSASIKELTLDTNVLNQVGGDVKVKAKGVNLTPAALSIKIYDQVDKDITNKILVSNFSGFDFMQNATLRFPSLNGETEAIYTVEIYLYHQLYQSETVKVIKDKEKPEYSIDMIIGDNVAAIASEGGVVEFRLITSSDLPAADIGVLAFVDGVSRAFKYNVFGNKNVKTVQVEVPPNNTEHTITYMLKFSTDKKASAKDYLDTPVYTVTVEPLKKTESLSVISDLLVKIPNLPKEGGQTAVTVKGSNLSAKQIELKVYDVTDAYHPVDVTDTLNPSILEGMNSQQNGEVLTQRFTFPALTGISEKNYQVEAYVKGERVKVAAVNVSIEGSIALEEPFKASQVFLADAHTIIVEFDHTVKEVVSGSLKDGISLDLDGDGNFDNLTSKDDAIINDKIITVSLAEDIRDQITASSQIRFAYRLLKDHRGVLNDRSSNYFISTSESVVENAEILTDNILLSSGGKVNVKLIGRNLIDFSDGGIENVKGTKVKVFKNAQFTDDIAIDGVSVKGDGKEQLISFDLPENNENKTQTYTIAVSVNGGLTYSSAVATSIYTRQNLLVIAVLPKGKIKTDQTLAFMYMKSYATNGGSEEAPDRTHVYTPINQESKKTWVQLYGTNFDKNKTKVRLKSEVDGRKNEYIYWYPVVGQGNYDSGDRFIMVGFDGTGVDGSGNFQRLEVICPRYYYGDMTYEYQVAMDGENYNEDINTWVTVLEDGENGGENLPSIADLAVLTTVNYVDEEGNQIAKSDKFTIVNRLPLEITQIKQELKQINGYEFKTIKGFATQYQQILDEYEKLLKLSKTRDLSNNEKRKLALDKIYVESAKKEMFNQILGDRDKLTLIYTKLADKSEETTRPVETSTTATPEDMTTQVESSTESAETSTVATSAEEITSTESVIETTTKNKMVETSTSTKLSPKHLGAVKSVDLTDKQISSNLPLISETLITDSPSVPLGKIDSIYQNNHWAKPAVKYIVGESIVHNYPWQTKDLDHLMSRGEVIGLIYALDSTTEALSLDERMIWARDQGLIIGYEDGSLKPNQLVNRYEMAVIIERYIKQKQYQFKTIKSSLKDDNSVVDWAKRSVDFLSDSGVVNGKNDYRFDGRSTVTLGEIAQVIFNIYTLKN